jgi:acid phosphatase type 7
MLGWVVVGLLLGDVVDAGPAPADAGATTPAPPEKWILVGAGDIADCTTDDDDKTARLVDAVIKANKNVRVFTAGDNAYPAGRAQDFASCYAPTWGRFKDKTLATPGNHDYLTQDAAPFASYFGFTAGQPFWRSVDVGAWHIVLLDSNCGPNGKRGGSSEPVECGPTSPQAQWLEEDLRKSTAKCTALIWHHARFSSGLHGSDERVSTFWDIADRLNADLVLQGHDHSYERFEPLNARGERVEKGMVSFVVGTGGRQAYPFRSRASGSVIRESGTAGVLVLELEETQARFRFVRDDGSIGDRGTIICR